MVATSAEVLQLHLLELKSRVQIDGQTRIGLQLHLLELKFDPQDPMFFKIRPSIAPTGIEILNDGSAWISL